MAVLLIGLTASGCQAQTFLLPMEGQDVVGHIKAVRARYEDTLSDMLTK